MMSICHGCGLEVVRIHRRYREECFCQACYSQLFLRRYCPSCGCMARLYIADISAVCRSCERAAPCIRCGRIGRLIGKLTRDGPVCNSCAHVFRELRSCACCGRMSNNLSKSSASGFEGLLCTCCARSHYGSCQMCGRYRELSSSLDHRRVCLKCARLGYISCTVCGEIMPGGYGRRCQECYWRSRFSQRLEKGCLIIGNSKVGNRYRQFCLWLCKTYGNRLACIKMGRYGIFFEEVNALKIAIFNYQLLLTSFGAARLRRFPLIAKWLQVNEQSPEICIMKILASEQLRIQYILSKTRSPQAQKVFEAYMLTMKKRYDAGNITLTSLRFALAAASNLFANSEHRGHLLPVQSDLNSYLRKSPGMRAQLTGIVNYLNSNYTNQLVLPRKRTWNAIRRHRKTRYINIMKRLITRSAKPEKMKWIRIGLALFHNMTLTQARRLLERASVLDNDKSYIVRVSEGDYLIPYLSTYSGLH